MYEKSTGEIRNAGRDERREMHCERLPVHNYRKYAQFLWEENMSFDHVDSFVKAGDSFTASAASPRPLISGLPKFAKFTLTLPKLNSSVKLARQMAFCYTARYRPRKEPLLFSIVFSCPAAGGVKTIAARKADQRMLQGLGINIQGCDWNGKVDYALITVAVMTSMTSILISLFLIQIFVIVRMESNIIVIIIVRLIIMIFVAMKITIANYTSNNSDNY